MLRWVGAAGVGEGGGARARPGALTLMNNSSRWCGRRRLSGAAGWPGRTWGSTTGVCREPGGCPAGVGRRWSARGNAPAPAPAVSCTPTRDGPSSPAAPLTVFTACTGKGRGRRRRRGPGRGKASAPFREACAVPRGSRGYRGSGPVSRPYWWPSLTRCGSVLAPALSMSALMAARVVPPGTPTGVG